MKEIYSLHLTPEILYNFSPIIMGLLLLIIFKTMKALNFIDLNKYKLGIMITFFLLSCIEIAMIASLYEEYSNVYISYKNKQYNIVEGDVSNFISNTSESFYIGEVYFNYPRKDGIMYIGYRDFEDNGGIFHENLKNIRVAYVNYNNRNVIVAVWNNEG